MPANAGSNLIDDDLSIKETSPTGPPGLDWAYWGRNARGCVEARVGRPTVARARRGIIALRLKNMATPREKFILDKKGKKKGVVLSLRRYRRLMEDLHDLAVVAERRREKPISFAELSRRLRQDGAL